MRQRVLADGGGHGLHGFHGVQHADFGGVRADVADDGINLRGEDGRGRGVDGRDAAGVLRRQRRERAHAVAAQRGEGFEIGLDARAAAAVRAGDGEDADVLAIGLGVHGRAGRIRKNRPKAVFGQKKERIQGA